MKARLATLVAFTGFMVPSPVRAQPDRDAARAAIDRWLALVRDGSADAAWNEASPAFQYRIRQSEWRAWVRAMNGQLPASAHRELEFTVGHDEAPLAPLTWVRAVLATTRPAGGRVLERVVVWEEKTGWRVAHYAAWMDEPAIVAGGAVSPIPYDLAFQGQFTFRDRIPWWPAHPGPRRGAEGSGLDRPTNRANPATYPRKPPP